MSIDNIFCSMYQRVRTDLGDVPPNVDKALLCASLWETSEKISVRYIHYRWLVMDILKLSGQERIVKESWRKLIGSGYLTKISEGRNPEEKQNMKGDLTEIHRLEMRYIRPIVGIPEPGSVPASQNVKDVIEAEECA